MSDGPDHCPHCHQRFEIIFVKFAAFGARSVSSCPNCALSPIDPRSMRTTSRYFSGTRMIEALNSRFKIIVFMGLAAILIAGFLRHVLHVYGGISREDIRADSLLLICAFGIVIVFFKVLRQRYTQEVRSRLSRGP